MIEIKRSCCTCIFTGMCMKRWSKVVLADIVDTDIRLKPQRPRSDIIFRIGGLSQKRRRHKRLQQLSCHNLTEPIEYPNCKLQDVRFGRHICLLETQDVYQYILTIRETTWKFSTACSLRLFPIAWCWKPENFSNIYTQLQLIKCRVGRP